MAAAASASSDDAEASGSDFEPDEEAQAQTEVASSHLSRCTKIWPQHAGKSSCMARDMSGKWCLLCNSCASASVMTQCTLWQEDELSTDAGLTEEEEAEDQDEEKPAR